MYLKLPVSLAFLPMAVPSFLSVLQKLEKKKVKEPFIHSNVVSSMRKLQLFLCLHLIYVWFYLSDRFVGCFSINIQLFLYLQSVIYYLQFPLNYFERNLAKKFINLFGFALLFSTFLTAMGFDILGTASNSGSRSFGILGDQEAWVYSIYATVFLFRLKYFYCILFVSGILINGSIGALIIFTISSFVFLYCRINMINLMRYFGGIVVALLLFFLLNVSDLSVFKRITNIDELVDNGPIGHRLLALESAFDYLGTNFLLGWGNYSLYIQNVLKDSLGESEMGTLTYLSSSNNQILDIYLHFGLVGLMIFLSFLSRVAKFLSKYNTENTSYFLPGGLYVWFCVFIFFNQTAVWFLPGSLILIIFCLLISTLETRTLTQQQDRMNEIVLRLK